MKTGDLVTVSPVVHPNLQSEGRVLIASSNGLSLAIAFPDCVPPWMRSRPGLLVSDCGVTCLAEREPGGPHWVDVLTGTRLTIEPHGLPTTTLCA